MSVRGHAARAALGLLAVMILVGGALPSRAASSSVSAPAVVASFSILGEWATRLAPPGEVTVLVGAGRDCHVFEPTPTDLRKLREAKLILRVGLGFEPWLDGALRSANGSAKVVTVSEGIKGRQFPGGRADPHLWQDPRQSVQMVDRLARALEEVFPKDRAALREREVKLKGELTKLHEDLTAMFSKLPSDHRTVITAHDAFGAFADAYGLKMLSPQGWSTETDPSAKDVARLIRQIRETKAKALFLEDLASSRVLEQISRETKVPLKGPLYADSLSASGGPASTYDALMRWNAEALRQALAPRP